LKATAFNKKSRPQNTSIDNSIHLSGEQNILINHSSLTTITGPPLNNNQLLENKFILDFKNRYANMNNQRKWKLKTGKVVEDTLYHFGLSCSYEHLSHSFIFNPQDINYVSKGIFTTEEVEEIIKYDAIRYPTVNEKSVNYLNRFEKVKNTRELRTLLSDCSWYTNYFSNQDAEVDWIRRSIDTLLLLYEKGFLQHQQTEQFYQGRVWIIIDNVFEQLDYVTSIRGETCSSSSSLRKNTQRTVPTNSKMQAKKLGHRGDLIIKRNMIELGCSEDKSSDDDTNYYESRDMYVPKMMKDMLCCLFEEVKFDIEKMKSLCTIGISTFGLDIYMDVMDVPKGYVSRITRSNKYQVPHEVDCIPKDLLPLLSCLLSLKDILKRNIDIIAKPTSSLRNSLKRPFDGNMEETEENEFKNSTQINVCSKTPEDNTNSRFKSIFK
jgi:hypothetical protein